MKIRCASCAAVWWSAAQDALTLDNARKTPCDVIVCSWFGHVDFMRRTHTACVCCRGLTRRVCTGACQPESTMNDLPSPTLPLSPVSLPRGHFIARTLRARAAVWKWLGRATSTR
jgi:hypothetical protein